VAADSYSPQAGLLPLRSNAAFIVRQCGLVETAAVDAWVPKR